MSAINDDGASLGQLAAPMIGLLGRATDRTDDDRIVGLESRAPPNVDDDRSRLGAEPDIKGLWRNRKTALTIHDCALLASRVAQNLDGRPPDGASALPRTIHLPRSATARKTHRFISAPLGSLGVSWGEPPLTCFFLGSGPMLTSRIL